MSFFSVTKRCLVGSDFSLENYCQSLESRKIHTEWKLKRIPWSGEFVLLSKSVVGGRPLIRVECYNREVVLKYSFFSLFASSFVLLFSGGLFFVAEKGDLIDFYPALIFICLVLVNIYFWLDGVHYCSVVTKMFFENMGEGEQGTHQNREGVGVGVGVGPIK